MCSNEFGTQCPVSSLHDLSTVNFTSRASNSESVFSPYLEQIFRMVFSIFVGGSHGLAGRKNLDAKIYDYL